MLHRKIAWTTWILVALLLGMVVVLSWLRVRGS